MSEDSDQAVDEEKNRYIRQISYNPSLRNRKTSFCKVDPLAAKKIHKLMKDRISEYQIFTP